MSVAASRASGQTVIRDAGELRVKETDRITAMAVNLAKAGIGVQETEDGMVITGSERFSGCSVDSFGDHRIAMSMLIAGLAADGPVSVSDTACIGTSFPGFLNLLEAVRP